MMGEKNSLSFVPQPQKRMAQITKDNLLSFLEYAFVDPSKMHSQHVDYETRSDVRPYLKEAHLIDGPLSSSDKTRLDRILIRIAADQKKRSQGKSSEWNENQEDSLVRGKIMEYALLPHHIINVWFGEASFLSKTHEFDDKINKTDLVLTMEEDGLDPIHLAIDVTTTGNTDIVREKLETIYDAIDKGTMATLRYFEEHPDVAGKTGSGLHALQFVPRVVIPMDRDTFDEFSKITADFLSGRGDAAEKSSIPTAILKCVQRQLATQIAYVRKRTLEKKNADGSTVLVPLTNKDQMEQQLLKAYGAVLRRYDELKISNKDRVLDRAQQEATLPPKR